MPPTFKLDEDEQIMLETSATGRPGKYSLEDGMLKANTYLTASASIYEEIPRKEVSFKYNAQGLRTKKRVQLLGKATETEYILHGKLVTEMVVRKYEESDPTNITQTDTLHFFYDAQSRPAKVEYNGEMYTYLHNLQGDITGIVDAGGQTVVKYSYDAWGNTVTSLGASSNTLHLLNPFRYKEYIYDEETRLFYLCSRYYSSFSHRFINCDILIDIQCELLSSNGFCYCYNSPIDNSDIIGLTAFGSNPPPPEAGYIPPKTGAVKVPSDFGRGWRDSNGNIWVPSPNGHGGDHWDVYRKDGKGYDNAYPDGHIRRGKGKPPIIPPTSPQPNATPMPSPTPSPRQEIYLPTPNPGVIIDKLPDPQRLQPPDDLPEPPSLSLPTWVIKVAALGVALGVGICFGPTVGEQLFETLTMAF